MQINLRDSNKILSMGIRNSISNLIHNIQTETYPGLILDPDLIYN